MQNGILGTSSPSASGAFSYKRTGGSVAGGSGWSYGSYAFDSSRESDRYKESSTIQPDSVYSLMIIKV